MSDLPSPALRAVGLPLPWGPVLRGQGWGAGPDVVLLLHELGADLDAWGALPADIARSLGVEAIAVDLPGHGLSDDPWEASRTAELVRFLMGGPGDSFASSRSDLTSPPAARVPGHRPGGSRPVEPGEGGIPAAGHHFVIAAGSIAGTTLTLAANLELAGMVCLSPDTAEESIEPSSRDRSAHGNELPIPPSPGSTGAGYPLGGGRGVRVVIPKLLIAGSHAGNDLAITRRLATTFGGRTVVTSYPVAQRGTGLLATPWAGRLTEEIIAFLRDCQRRRPPHRQRFATAPVDTAPG